MTESTGIVTSHLVAMECQQGELRNPLAAIREETTARGVLSREEALEILTRIARGKLSTYLDDDGHVDPRKVKALGGPEIQSYETTTRGGVVSCRLRLHDPIRAIELIARMCGWDKQAAIARRLAGASCRRTGRRNGPCRASGRREGIAPLLVIPAAPFSPRTSSLQRQST